MTGNDVIMSPADYARMLRRWWWLLVVIPVLFAVATYQVLSNRDRSYTATTTLLVSQGSLLEASAGGDIQDANALTQVYSRLATSPAVLQRVDEELAGTEALSETEVMIGAEADPLLPVLTIWAEAGDPELAALVASTTARALIAWLDEQNVERTGESSQTLQQRIDEVWATIQTTSEELAALRNQDASDPATEAAVTGLESALQQYWATYESLLELQQRLELEALSAQNQLAVIAPAEIPEVANQRPPVLFAVVAAVFGLGVAAMAIGAIELLNRRLRSPLDVQRAVSLPLLASVPRFHRLSSRRRRALPTMMAPDSTTADAYRVLRTRFQMSVNGHGLGVIAVTGAGSDSRAADVAANLAIAFAETGLRVTLVEADLRSPSYHRVFHQPEPTAGLATLLATPRLRPEMLLVPGPHPRLRILLAGTDSTTPSRIGSLGRLRQILSELRADADVVVVLAPPVLTVSDGLVAAGAADSVLLVADAGKTRPEELQSAAANLAGMQLSVQGVVLNGVDRRTVLV